MLGATLLIRSSIDSVERSKGEGARIQQVAQLAKKSKYDEMWEKSQEIIKGKIVAVKYYVVHEKSFCELKIKTTWAVDPIVVNVLDSPYDRPKEATCALAEENASISFPIGNIIQRKPTIFSDQEMEKYGYHELRYETWFKPSIQTGSKHASRIKIK